MRLKHILGASLTLLVSQTGWAATASYEYFYTTTNSHGATTASGDFSSIATLTMSDRIGGGVSFNLTTHGLNNFGPGQPGDNAVYVSGLFLLADDDASNEDNNLDMTDWTFSNVPGSDAAVATAEFGEDEEPSGYRYLIEVNFLRPLASSDALTDGETVEWIFEGTTGGGVSVANLLLNSFTERDGGSGPDLFSTLKLRGVPGNGFWGSSEFIFNFDTVHVGAPVPVPAALPLLASGLSGLGWMKSRSKRASN